MRLQSILASIVPLAFLTGCFGDGPPPEPPEEAIVLYTVPPTVAGDECNASRYIDSVGLGPNGTGYVLTVPYVPTNPCSGPFLSGPVPVESFSMSEKLVEELAGAGSVDAPRITPRLTATGDGAIWAYNESATLIVDPGNTRISDVQGNASAVAGLAQDTDFIYLATWSEPGNGLESVNNPNYPCCAPIPENSAPGAIRKISKANRDVQLLGVTPAFACETLDECFASNTTDLFYVERTNTSSSVTVNRYSKTGSSTAEVLAQVTGDGQANTAVVGLAVTDTHVAWSESTQYLLQGFNTTVAPPSCKITVFTLATGQAEVVLDTPNFSCAHTALDESHVYFAIIDVNTTSQSLSGVGVARVDVVGAKVESFRHGMGGELGGPRRVYLSGDTMYLVTSFAIAAVKKSALSDRLEFVP